MPVPPQVPVVKFLSPEKDDQGLIEFWDTTTQAYVPLDLGSLHPDTREHPGFKLAKQANLPNDHRWVIRIWVKDDTNPNWFGYAIKYVAESTAHPIFIRTTRELRKTYSARTKLQPLKSVYQLKLASAGSGYSPGTFPAVTGTGGAGSGLAGRAIVAPDGTIVDLVLDSGGDNYTSAPAVVIAAPPSGTTATGTALLQPATALLVVEQADEFPPESEFNGLYLNVTRVYQTTPGPATTKKSVGIPVLTPPKFQRQVQTTDTKTPVVPSTALPTLSGTQSSAVVEQTSTTEALQTITDRTIDTNADPLVSKDTNDALQVVTRTEQLRDATDTPPVPSATRKVTFDAVGDGTAVQSVETVPYVFDAKSRQVGTPIVFPERFRASAGVSTNEDTIAGTVPDSVSLGAGEVQHSEDQVTEFTKRVKTTAFDIGSAPTLEGQEYDPQLDVPIPYQETLEASGTSLGDNRKDISPLSDEVDLVRTANPTALAAVFDSYLLSFPGTTNLELPDVLTSLKAVTNKDTGNGSYSESAAGSSSGDTFYLTHAANGSAQGSASLSPELIVEIKQFWGRNIPTANYFFFLPLPVTADQVLAKLLRLVNAVSHAVTVTIASPGVFSWTAHTLSNGDAITLATSGALPTGLTAGAIYYVVNKAADTFQLALTPAGTAINTSGSQSGTHTVYAGITNWPKFVPQAHTILLKGGKVSSEARAKSAAQVSSSGSNFSTSGTHGSGTSVDRTTSIRAVRIPPCIHGAITIDVSDFDTSASCTVQVVAAGSVFILGGTVGTDVDTGVITKSAAASITPSSLAATSVTTIPTTGKALMRTNVEPYKWGYARCAAEVVDMTNVG